MIRPLTHAAALGGLALAGCAGSGTGADGDWAGSIRDSAGISIVENTGEGTWDASEAWTVREVLRIGSSEADPEFATSDPAYQFGQISGIAVSSRDHIFVLDQQAQELRAFDAEGQLVATIGQPGSGPGEFGPGAGPALMARGDTLLIPDPANQRVTLYTPGGDYISSWSMNFQTSGIPIRWETGAHGTVASQVRPLGLPGQASASDPMDAVIMKAADGTVIDTLMEMESGKTFSFGGQRPEFNFFAAEPVWALYPGNRLLFAVNDAYSIRVVGPDGVVERVLRMPTERSAVGQADQDAFVGAITRAWESAGVPPQAMSQLTSAISFAESYPAFLQFFAGPEATIWVQHVADVSAMSEEELRNFNPLLTLGGTRWDVFDPDGRFLGPVEMPARFQPIRFEDEKIYGIWRDDYDVQHVMVLAVSSS